MDAANTGHLAAAAPPGGDDVRLDAAAHRDLRRSVGHAAAVRRRLGVRRHDVAAARDHGHAADRALRGGDAYDDNRDRLVIFSGSRFDEETWELAPDGSWSLLSTGGGPGGPLRLHDDLRSRWPARADVRRHRCLRRVQRFLVVGRCELDGSCLATLPSAASLPHDDVGRYGAGDRQRYRRRERSAARRCVDVRAECGLAARPARLHTRAAEPHAARLRPGAR